MTLLPQSLFGRLFAALIVVAIITLLIVAALIARERRDLAFLNTGAWITTRAIADTSETLAKLQSTERTAAIQNLREHPLVLDELRRRRPPPNPEELRALQNAFAAQLRKQLGPGYGVNVQRASADNKDLILVEGVRRTVARAAARTARENGEADVNREPEDRPGFGPGPGPGPAGAGDSPPLDRFRGPRPPFLAWLYDITVTLPDGQRVMFRTVAPVPAPPLPSAIFVELGILTVMLGVALFFMALTITRPLRALSDAADAVGRGAYNPPLAEKGARELRRATRAFNVMQERLRRYLDSRTRVLAAMSHDLRTTLTRLRLRAESIENDELRQRFSADLDEMSQMVQGALGLFKDLNDDEPPAPVDVDALLGTLTSEFQEMDADVVVHGRMSAPFSAKPLALKRCLTNLLHNAIKYGTRATVFVSDGDEMVIRIRDEGPGIPAASLDQVFEPFFRLEASRSRDTGGAGLGLSIARDIAQAHGGSIVLSNIPGGGLEAALTIPRAASGSVIKSSEEVSASSETNIRAGRPAPAGRPVPRAS